MHRSVVFAYHNVGVRCLRVLLEEGVDVALVVTHEDNPGEDIWFASVAQLAEDAGIRVIKPADPNTPELLALLQELNPDFLFSFYYRHMLKEPLLEVASRGAFNMHGSLLPLYRGRVPVNWAVLQGEKETGATLHEMTVKPDAGRIVDQEAVPILPDDTAQDVFEKVTFAAESTLRRALPRLLDGTAELKPQDLSAGSYFSGRKPEDGRIDWHQGAVQIHNLVRAVAPPYPGAFCDIPAGRLRVLRTQVSGAAPDIAAPALYTAGEELLVACSDGNVLKILAAELNSQPLSAAQWRALHGAFPFYLGRSDS
ncbi:MAG TPA: formyltransferase [Burkholderiales bacterium]|nr:formyltransferase [Burkholderiales bacterium]